MKKIAIITEYFAPMNMMAANRFTKIAKYLSRNDKYEVVIITKKHIEPIKDIVLQEDRKEIERKCKIIEVDPESVLVSLIQKLKEQMGHRNQNFLTFLATWIKSRNFKKKAWKEIKKKYNYDVIITTYGEYGSHLLGEIIKKHNKDVYWIADFRDSLIWPGMPKILNRFCMNFSYRITSKANITTLVAPMNRKQIKIHPKTKKLIITNGYDKEDKRHLKAMSSDNKFHMVYTGTIYKGLSDFSLLFYALLELHNEKNLNLNNVIIDYAGKQSKLFTESADRYGISKIVKNHGYVNRLESMNLQYNSNVLLLSSWNNKNSIGIVTGKVYEYLMMYKPILCIVSGDKSNSALKRIISKANVGFCYEEASKQEDYAKLKSFILKQYLIYKKNRKDVNNSINYNYINKFDYINITRKLINIID